MATSKNPHPIGVKIYKDDLTDAEYRVQQVYLPLYLARTTQSTAFTSPSDSNVLSQNKNIAWVARARTDELENPINKTGKKPDESISEHIYEEGGYRTNQRLEYKMRRQCVKNIEFMLKHEQSLQDALRKVTLDGFVEKTEQLKSQISSAPSDSNSQSYSH